MSSDNRASVPVLHPLAYTTDRTPTRHPATAGPPRDQQDQPTKASQPPEPAGLADPGRAAPAQDPRQRQFYLFGQPGRGTEVRVRIRVPLRLRSDPSRAGPGRHTRGRA